MLLATAQSVISRDRLKYADLLSVARDVANERHNTAHIVDDPLAPDHVFIYSTDAWGLGCAVASALHAQCVPLGRYAMVMHRATAVAVAADGRDLVTITNIPTMAVLPLVQLLIHLRILTDITQYEHWPRALAWLAANHSPHTTGGREGRSNGDRSNGDRSRGNPIPLDLVKSMSKAGVIVGPLAVSMYLQKSGGAGRPQMVTSDLKGISRWLGPDQRCGLANPMAPDTRLRRLTCSAGETKFDAYSAAEYSLVPWTELRGLRVGTPLTVAYYRIIDAWIVTQLGEKMSVSAQYVADFVRQAQSDANAMIQLALGGEPFEQIVSDARFLYGTIRDQDREARRNQKGEVYMPSAK